jgi:hypothetical protein
MMLSLHNPPMPLTFEVARDGQLFSSAGREREDVNFRLAANIREAAANCLQSEPQRNQLKNLSIANDPTATSLHRAWKCRQDVLCWSIDPE